MIRQRATHSEAVQDRSQREIVGIEKLVYGGDGLGRIEGRVVLMPYVLPGEKVSVQVEPAKGGVLRGRSPEILEVSAQRVEPRCEYFGDCGGCQYQQAAYEFQVTQKIEILRETLQRLGRVTYTRDIPAITGHPWFYRNRIQLHFAHGKAGFQRPASHDLCAVDHCFIASPLLVEAISRLQEAAKRREWPSFLRSLELFANDSELQLNVLEADRPVAARFFEWCRTFLPAFVPGAISYPAAGHLFRISGGSFFQVNRFLIEALVNEVIAGTSGKVAFDLYAGVGLFSAPLATRLERVYAVERGKSASLDLEHNVRESRSNVKVVRDSAQSFLSRCTEQNVDLLIADPPRSGLGSEMIESILGVRPQSVKIISCDPATLARDLPKLLDSYEIERVALVDLFPHTYHFETVVHLQRK